MTVVILLPNLVQALFMASIVPDQPRSKTGRKRVTLSTVAREAGVAVSTASAILRGEKTSWASEVTRARVFSAAKKVEYRPNQIARSLRSQESNLIGLAFHSLDMHPIPMAKLAEVERHVIASGYQVLIRNHHGRGRDEIQSLLADYLSYQVAGVILMPSHEVEEQIQWLLSTGLPAVTIDAANVVHVPNVAVDRVRGAYLQVKHLMEDAGCRRLAFFMPGGMGSQADPAAQKMDGFTMALEECGSSREEHLFFRDEVDSGYEFGRRAANALLESGEFVDGVVATSDQVALTAMDVLTHAGVRVPEDVAVIGFDGQAFAAHLAVPLSTVCQPAGIGRIAVEMLIDQLKSGQKKTSLENRLLLPELVVRASSDPARRGRANWKPDSAGSSRTFM
ncbi:LacI family DNA-binding transcriptional regulator [Phycisphaerales bacterium AB-hyl4]|uniref:LacI family DNA-binding transcriptional regulator n=1 Tax=Natronomicrosphaera hydrolytica TaxID=3242702 RepID=A0ABV4U8W4_9BACT